MNKGNLIFVSALLAVFLIAGQAAVYWANPYSFDSEISVDGDVLNYSLSSTSSVDYSVVIFENGLDLDELYIYHDADYAVNGTQSFQKKFTDQLIVELERRNTDVTKIDADGLRDIMSSDPTGVGVVITSGAFPSTVYSETEDLALQWVRNGGTLYWAGGAIDSCYAETDGIHELADPGSRFFGVAGTVNMDEGYGTDGSDDRTFGEILGLNWNGLSGGLAVGLTDTLYVGYQNDEFSSISLTSVDNGMVAVFGGKLSDVLRASLAQTICSGLSNSVDSMEEFSGSFKGELKDSADISGMGSFTAYVCYGADYPVYGKRYIF